MQRVLNRRILPHYQLLMRAVRSRPRMLRLVFAGIVLILCCRSMRAQFYLEPTPGPVATPPPIELFHDLTACRGFSGSCDERSAAKQVSALSALGIPAKFADDARLLFEDLDGDSTAEALLTVDVDGGECGSDCAQAEGRPLVSSASTRRVFLLVQIRARATRHICRSCKLELPDRGGWPAKETHHVARE